ncbi:HAMP domain-containing sensor histidine kinase [Haladaptatus sp. ZSTT2]|uniref:HAMP domain-containing sensor histidine kinase n=1 Tax=Haladaptatus sp. ZSTT2 TaxID=3120515 RepID=UPI00300EF0CF
MTTVRRVQWPDANDIPQGIIGLGVVLFFSHFWEWVVDPASFSLVLSPGLLANLVSTFPLTVGIVLGGYWLRRSDLSRQRYTRIAKWCLGCLFLFLAINVVIIVVLFIEFLPADQQTSLLVGWLRFAIATGAASGLFIGIIEARAIDRELTAQRATIRAAELEQQSDQLEFFNSILRHDVLNGMTVIRGRAELLTETEADELRLSHAETILRWSDDIVQVIQRVRRILETLTEGAEYERHTVNLSAMLEAELERVSTTYPTVTFDASIPPDVTVEADDLLSEVFGNILTNAVEHNDPTDLTVTTAVTVGPKSATVRITDTGKGIPDGEKETIFRRGESSHANKSENGFGLFFVDSMVTAYGGTVHVVDSQPHGAEFVIDLPRAS